MHLFRIPVILLAIATVVMAHYGIEPASMMTAIPVPNGLRELLLDGLLALFLFAAALQVRNDGTVLNNIRLVMLATLTLGLTTMIVAYMFWWLAGRLELEPAWGHCLLFGVLIAPTDPLGVGRLMRSAGADLELTGKVAAESVWSNLFAVILFLALLQTAAGDTGRGGPLTALLLQQTIGAVLLGAVTGTLLVFLFRQTARAAVLIALSLAVVIGAVAIALFMNLSGPVAAAVGGVLLAMCRGRWAIAEPLRDRLTRFWSSLGEAAVVILLVWFAVTLTAEPVSLKHLTVGVLMIPVVLVTRMFSVGVPVKISVLRAQLTHEVIRIMAWGSVRSAPAIVLALTLPPGPETRVILVVTFVILVFSLLMQGPVYSLKARIERPLANPQS